MKLFYYECDFGCAIIQAADLAAARRTALREVGTFGGLKSVRLATERDCAWVRRMGGRVPEIETAE